MIVSGKDLRRFSAKVEVNLITGCWIWTAYTEDGYGRFRFSGKVWLSHKFAYETVHGRVPEGLELDHLCRNRSCVNPAHLEAVTQEVNRKRGMCGANQRVKTHCPQGHPYDAANTHVKHGSRSCRACAREYMRRYRRQRRPEGMVDLTKEGA